MDEKFALTLRHGVYGRTRVRILSVILAVMFSFVCVSRADESVVDSVKSALSVARTALRDGLWDIARLYARKVSSEESNLIVLESYAHEGKWKEIEKILSNWGDAPKGDAYFYYKAMIEGNYDLALKHLKAASKSGCIGEEAMLEADLLAKKGERVKAEDLWRKVISSTNSTDRAFVIAAVNLGDENALRLAQKKSLSSNLALLVSVRLGEVLLDDANSLVEAERIVRAAVKSAPDTPGAKEAFIKLGRIKDMSGDWKAAASVWRDVMEIWPAEALSPDIHQYRGETFFKLGKLEEALSSFETAQKLAKANSSQLASAWLRQGDVLSRLDRMEEAMKCYRKVLSDCPETEIAKKLRRVVEIMEMETKGREFFKAYRFAEAQKSFSAVAAADPKRKSRMEFFDVLCLYGLGHDEMALEKVRTLVFKCPDEAVRADATLWLAKFMFNRSEWKEASHLFQSYAEISPSSPAAPDALCWAAKASFADADYKNAIQISTRLVEKYPSSQACAGALVVQGESLVELARYTEALLVLERVASNEKIDQQDRIHARLLVADALFALGADNSRRYLEALKAYRALRFGGLLDDSGKITVSFRIGRTLEKLGRYEESVDEYYSRVVLSYRDGRARGILFDDSAKAAFSRAAFRLADEYEGHGREFQAMNILRLVSTSDVPAAKEAARRLERISKKGRLL